MIREISTEPLVHYIPCFDKLTKKLEETPAAIKTQLSAQQNGSV